MKIINDNLELRLSFIIMVFPSHVVHKIVSIFFINQFSHFFWGEKRTITSRRFF